MISKDCAIRDYADLLATLTQRRRDLGLSQGDVDYISGLHEGYTGKLEVWRHPKSGRKLGPISMPTLFGALGIAIILITNKGEVLPRVHARAGNRKPEPVVWPNPDVAMGTGKHG